MISDAGIPASSGTGTAVPAQPGGRRWTYNLPAAPRNRTTPMSRCLFHVGDAFERMAQ